MKSNHLTPEELQHAESYWIKEASSGGTHCSRSAVRRRTWSVEMRRKSWKCWPTNWHPVFLDSQHYLTTLIVRDAHTRIQHNGICETLTEVRDKFWIVRGRSFVRMVIRKCVTCRRYDGRPHPSSRVHIHWCGLCRTTVHQESPGPEGIQSMDMPVYRTSNSLRSRSGLNPSSNALQDFPLRCIHWLHHPLKDSSPPWSFL